MSTRDVALGRPSEWCDRRCERCPLADSCGVFARERGRRWAHEMRGRDAVGNLLLIDHVKRDLCGLLVARGRLDALEAMARLETLLLPLVASVERYRPALDALVATNRAPSPFLTRQGLPIA